MATSENTRSSMREEVMEISFADTLRTLYMRRMTIIVVVIVALVAGGVLASLPRRYTAEGAIRVEPGKSNVYQLSSLTNLLSGETDDIIASEVEMLQSRTLYLRAAKELNLVNDSEFWGGRHPKPSSLDDPKTREKVYRRFKGMLKVKHDPKNEIIDISCTSVSPALSSRIVNTLINDYVAYLFEMRYGATKRASGWLIDQLGTLKDKIEKDQVELTKLQAQLGVVGLDEKSTAYLNGQSLSELTKASDDASIERIIAEAKLRFIQESNPHLIEGEINILPQPTGLSSQGQSLLASLRNDQAQAATNYARLLTQFGPNYPDVKQQKAQLDSLSAQVDAEEKRIVNQAQLSFDAASANEKMTTAKVQQEKAKVYGSHDAMVRFILLAKDYEADRGLYEGLIQHLQEAGITSGLEAGDIDVVDLADLPAIPNAPGPILIMLGTLVGGLLVGGSLALWAAALDIRIRGPEHAEQITGLPLLAQIPHVKVDKAANAKSGAAEIFVTAWRSHYAEAMQSLRSALLLAKPGTPPKVILVASSTPSEGKSTTGLNLAATFARYGSRVLVCDCDLRRGSIAARLGIGRTKGLTSVLTRQVSLEDAILQVPDVPGLFALLDGPRSPDPGVLIGSDEMRKVISTCREQFDIVILDSPPVLGISDGLGLGQFADSVILVIRESVSNTKAVKESAHKMAASHLAVVGFVYNDVDPRASSYGYGYGYRNYYEGYYSDAREDSK